MKYCDSITRGHYTCNVKNKEQVVRCIIIAKVSKRTSWWTFIVKNLNDTSAMCNNVLVNIMYILFCQQIHNNNNILLTKCDNKQMFPNRDICICNTMFAQGIKTMATCNLNSTRWYIESFVESIALIRSSKASMLKE